jgi:hypothetical protein
VARVTTLQRAALRLRARGYCVEVTRRRKGAGGCQRHALFGFADLVGLRPGQPPVAVLVVESPSDGFHAAVKLPGQAVARAWLAVGLIQVWALHRTGPGRHHLWHEFTVTLDQRGN